LTQSGMRSPNGTVAKESAQLSIRNITHLSRASIGLCCTSLRPPVRRVPSTLSSSILTVSDLLTTTPVCYHPVMSTETALLRAIRDMPDEDTPRLMYADYLDEEGFSARAEFIRVQIALARLPPHDPQRAPLEDREHELLAEHECSWLGISPDDMDELTEWEFSRGFLHEVTASPFFMRGPGAELCASHPIRRWRVMGGQDNMEADLRDASQRGWFSRLNAIDLAGWFETIGQLSTFFSRAEFPLLQELGLTHREGVQHLPEILAHASFRNQLKVLHCGGSMYGEGGRLDANALVRALDGKCCLKELSVPFTLMMADDLRDLLRGECCRELNSLAVRDNEIAPDAWDAFRRARCRLHELDISHTPLGAISLDRLLGCASLSELRSLHMNGCGSAMTNLRALASSRFWTQAEELRMQQGSIPEASLEPLFKAAGPPNLRILDVAGNWVRDEGVAQLCQAPWTGSLAYLDVSQNYLSDEALRSIAKSGRFKNLHTLHLNFNSPYHQEGAEPDESITDAGLRLLADCPDLANLRILSVSGTRITAAGVDAVLNSPHWRLAGLTLSQCQLRPSVVEVLASSARLSRLEILDLSLNDEIDTDDLEPLAESEYLSPQMELNIRGISGENPIIRSTLRQRLGCRLSE